MSGRPGRLESAIRNRKPMRCATDLTTNSGAVPTLRTPRIKAERATGSR
jgi:hypothetical protein